MNGILVLSKTIGSAKDMWREPTTNNFEVRHPRCVGSITKNFCVLHIQSKHNCISPSSAVEIFPPPNAQYPKRTPYTSCIAAL